jgi:putative membrane-bound dehydrogenase-like protein
VFVLLSLCLAQDPAPLKNANGPFEPGEAVKHLFVPPGFKVTPVAHEPAIVDPVCMCFDAKGRIYVCEMPGYPNGGRALGEENRGKVKLLEDKDGDGFFETTTLFADGLRFPTGVTPYKDGVIVCNAPDIIYLKDTDGDGKADLREVWYTGFDLANIQQLPNSIQWGLDNKIWGMVAGTGGTITCPKKPNMKPVNLRGRAFRFDPATLGSFEPTSGGGQYGLCRDAAGTWFTCSNGNCVRQIVIPEELASRNPDYTPPAVTADIDVEGTAIKVFRKSPFETWRVERTTRRREGDDNRRFIPTELVPGGYTSSSCGCIIYDADLFPKNYYGSFFACDPGNNLIFRRVISPNGSIYKSSRPPEEKDHEFLASDDNWFRPVQLTLGPDGAIYVCDFYREVIETPLSIPDDLKKRLNVESRGRGRIWRVSPEAFPVSDIAKHIPQNDQLTRHNKYTRNQATRTHARRLLCESPELLRIQSFQDLSGEPLMGPPSLPFSKLPRISFALTAVRNEKLEPQDKFGLILSAIHDSPNDHWVHSVALLALPPHQVADFLIQIRPYIKQDFQKLTAECSLYVGRSNQQKSIEAILHGISDSKIDTVSLTGLGHGMKSKGKSLPALLANPPDELKPAVEKLRARFVEASTKSDEASIRLLAFAPFDLAKPALEGVLNLNSSAAVQQEAVRSLGQHDDASVPGLLLAKWAGYSPGVRKEVQEVLMSRPERTLALLAAVESGTVKPGELDPARVQQLRNHPRAEVKSKATKLFASLVPADRQKVLAEYANVGELPGDVSRGKAVFQTHCASCHKLDGIGNDVGPNLLATITGKSIRDLVTAILDPNREVDTRFLSYTATLNDGRVLTGIVASESANGLTLRRADGQEDVIARTDLESLKSSGQSLMPEGLEKQIKPGDLADLIAFLRKN